MTDELQDIISRLEKLEKAVFTEWQGKEVNPPSASNKYVGAKGGVLLLLENSFFKTPHVASEVKVEMEKNDYHYSIQVVQTALNRLASNKGPLTTMKMEKGKIYVKRK